MLFAQNVRFKENVDANTTICALINDVLKECNAVSEGRDVMSAVFFAYVD